MRTKPGEGPNVVRGLIKTIIVAALCYAFSEAHAQVFEISGGNSSLYQAGGGSLSMEAPGFDTKIGAGMIAGHFSYGTKMERVIGPTI